MIYDMKKLFIPFILIFCTALAACSHDDDDLSLILTGDELEATTWDATVVAKIDHMMVAEYHFVLEFLSKNSGACKDTYNEGSYYEGQFKYSITKEMIFFNGSIVGNWSVIEHKKDKIVLRAFLPEENIMTLNKMKN